MHCLQNKLFAAGIAILLSLELIKAGTFIAAGPPPLHGDAWSYWRLGRQAAQGDWFRMQPPDAIERPNGYPLFLGLHQLLFGKYALLAAAATQQLLVTATAALVAWMCWRLTRCRFTVLLGLAISLLCISRNCMASFMISDNLLAFLLTATLAVMLHWFERPTVLLAAGIGVGAALCTHVKPVTSLLWIPLVLAMGWHLWRSGKQGRVIFSHAAALWLCMAAVLAPWYARNVVLHGRLMFVQFSGRALWWACFDRAHDARPLLSALKFPETPAARSVLAKVAAPPADLANPWFVFRRLTAAGVSDFAADKLMEQVARDAIRAQPWRFARARLIYFGWYFVIADHIEHWQCPDSLTAAGGAESIPLDDTYQYDGQAVCYVPALLGVHEALVKRLWRPRRLLYAAAAVATLCSCLVLLRGPASRSRGAAFGLCLMYFPLVTVLFGFPDYRYRMILEPTMIVIVSAAATAFLHKWSAIRAADAFPTPFEVSV